MSGFLKSVGKVFKKIIKSPIFKAVAIAAAIYFTGGLALTAIGGEAAAFAATLPGISSAASALGIGEVASTALTSVGVGAEALADGTMFGTALADSGGATLLTTAADGTLMTAADAAAEVGAGAGDSIVGGAQTMPDSYWGMNASAGETMPASTSGVPMTDATAPINEISGGVNTGDVSGAANTGLQTNSPVTGSASNTGYGMGERSLGLANGGTLDTASLAALHPDQGAWGSIKQWYGKLDPLEKKILGEGITQLGKGALSQLSVKSQQDFQQALINQQRDDKKRLGQVPDITSSFSHGPGPGLINSVTQGPIKVGG